MRKYNVPIFVSHCGCPHDCAFCNQKKITGRKTDISPKEAEKNIAEYLENIPDDELCSIEIAFFGGSFTGIEKERQIEFLKAANKFFPKVSGIRVSTRPDYISNEILEMLKSYNVTSIELGVQSTNDKVLEMNRRGHTFEDVKNAVSLIRNFNFELGLQMMVGMYGSDEKKDLQTAKDIISLKPDTTRIYPTVTLKETALEILYEKGEYKPYSIERAAEISAKIIELFRENNVKVLRIGLHASEELGGGAVVAGPYHPAFGEIAESIIYRHKIENDIISKGIKNSVYTVKCGKSEVSKIMGHKKSNKEYFLKRYNVELKAAVEK